jgi:hypothetical protein
LEGRDCCECDEGGNIEPATEFAGEHARHAFTQFG